MKLSIGKALCASAFALTSLVSPSLADTRSVEEDQGWYFTVGTGMVAPNDSDLGITGDGDRFTGDADFTNSFTGDIGVGHDFGDLRVELTYGYSPQTSDKITLTDGEDTATVPLAVEYKIHSIQFGGYYDFSNNLNAINPYIGGTIGWAHVDVDSSTTELDGEEYSLASGDDQTMIWKALVGLSYAANEKADIFVEAGYQGIGDTDWNVTCEADTTCSDMDSDAFGGMVAKVGFRYRL